VTEERLMVQAHDLLCDSILVLKEINEDLPFMQRLAAKQLMSQMEELLRTMNNKIHEPEGDYA
tara:strand:+ start:1553 stop:1741 length:189 start_codon:yes stop_codon:yes gene_type:complete